LLFLIVYWLVNSKIQGSSYIKNIVAILGTVIIFLYSPKILSLITSIDLFSHYGNYKLSFGNMRFGITLIRLLVIFIILVNLKKLKSNNLFYKLIPLYFIGFLLLNFGYLADHLSRIGRYFEMLQIFI